jgi:hypothetical protein
MKIVKWHAHAKFTGMHLSVIFGLAAGTNNCSGLDARPCLLHMCLTSFIEMMFECITSIVKVMDSNITRSQILVPASACLGCLRTQL